MSGEWKTLINTKSDGFFKLPSSPLPPITMATGAPLTDSLVHDVVRLEKLDGVDVAGSHVVAQHLAVHHADEALTPLLGVQLRQGHLALEVLGL